MSEFDDAAVQELVALGRTQCGPQYVNGGNIPYVLVPEGCKVQAVPELIFNEHAARPERIKQKVSMLDPESFIYYYQKFSDPHSRVFAFEPENKVVGVLDYHADGEVAPRWGDHRATLTLRQSEEWKIWTSKNGTQLTQQQFAEFLEQNSMDITSPSPANMREVASDLSATTEVDFGSALRSQDGQVRFKYTETVKATVGAGQVAVPEQFTLSIPVFVGGARVSVSALLRFRNKEGKLIFWYTLIRPEEVIRAAFNSARNQIAETLKITILNGLPQ